jgi:hypothetical protein
MIDGKRAPSQPAANPPTPEEPMSFTPYLCGGEVQLPVSETSWSPAFGMCKDRFGILGTNPAE